MSGDNCPDCGALLDDFGQCMTCDTYGTPTEQAQDRQQSEASAASAGRSGQDIYLTVRDGQPLTADEALVLAKRLTILASEALAERPRLSMADEAEQAWMRG